jgi:UDP-glucose:(glucosyl)LPS alpha-1,3-glucosyltransferase
MAVHIARPHSQGDISMLAAYGATKNLYWYLPTAIGSLLRHNPDWRVIVYCEDDEIETLKDPRITIVNINTVEFPFDKNSHNMNVHFTYMALLRCLLPQLLPNEDKVLWIDVDTCVTGSLKDLENIDMSHKAVGGVMENKQPVRGAPKDFRGIYINSGVLLMNLSFIREYGFDKKWIQILQTRELNYPDQDAINLACNGFVKFLDVQYNYSPCTKKYDVSNPKIYHYTFSKIWDNPAVIFWRKTYIKTLQDKPDLED